MLLVRSRYALRGRKELKSELGGGGSLGRRKGGYGLMPFGGVHKVCTHQRGKGGHGKADKVREVA